MEENSTKYLIKENKYVNAPAIIEFLESQGANRANQIISNPGEVKNPLLTDIDLIHFSRDRSNERPEEHAEPLYIPSKQPYLELWTHLYQLAWDEHRHTDHLECICCNILKFLPVHLRDQPFTPRLLEDISKFQPSFEEVENLLSKS